MPQEQLKKSLQQVNEVKQKLQEQLNTQWSKASDELQRVLTELGAEPSDEKTLGEIVAEIRGKNPSFRQLMLSLDAATYDTRKKVSWDAHMISAYLWQKAETSYQRDLRPLVSNYRENAEARLQSLVAQAQKLRSQLASKNESAADEKTAAE